MGKKIFLGLILFGVVAAVIIWQYMQSDSASSSYSPSAGSSSSGISEEEHWENVYWLADDETAEWVVEKVYDGGKNIEIDVKQYSYNSYKEEYKIDVKISWCGYAFGGCSYYAEGIIRSDEDAGNLRWESTYHSVDLRDYISSMRLFKGTIGTVVVLEALGKSL